MIESMCMLEIMINIIPFHYLRTPEDNDPLTVDIPPDIARATPEELQVMLREMMEECNERDRNRRNIDLVKAGWGSTKITLGHVSIMILIDLARLNAR